MSHERGAVVPKSLGGYSESYEPTGVVLGLYWDYIGVILGLYWDYTSIFAV